MRTIPCGRCNADDTMRMIPCGRYHADDVMRTIPCGWYHADDTMRTIPCDVVQAKPRCLRCHMTGARRFFWSTTLVGKSNCDGHHYEHCLARAKRYCGCRLDRPRSSMQRAYHRLGRPRSSMQRACSSMQHRPGRTRFSLSVHLKRDALNATQLLLNLNECRHRRPSRSRRWPEHCPPPATGGMQACASSKAHGGRVSDCGWPELNRQKFVYNIRTRRGQKWKFSVYAIDCCHCPSCPGWQWCRSCPLPLLLPLYPYAAATFALPLPLLLPQWCWH